MLSPQFPLVGEHPPLNTHKQNSNTKPSCASIGSASGGCTSFGQPTHTCVCPQRTAVPPPPSSLPFSCIPENNAKMREWLSDKYAASTFNTCPHIPLHCMAGPPIEIHVDTLAKPVACHTPSPTALQWQQKVHNDLIPWTYWKKCHTASLLSGAIAWSVPENMMDLLAALRTCRH